MEFYHSELFPEIAVCSERGHHVHRNGCPQEFVSTFPHSSEHGAIDTPKTRED